jgi:secreted trypsin-like serine protease
VRAGMVDSTEGTVYKVSKLIKHERYNNDNMENSDIALLSLSEVIRAAKKGRIDLINGVNFISRNNL